MGMKIRCPAKNRQAAGRQNYVSPFLRIFVMKAAGELRTYYCHAGRQVRRGKVSITVIAE
jgi:hypothetical protein